jgi:tetratricopeptide (TPR) repeat protein
MSDRVRLLAPFVGFALFLGVPAVPSVAHADLIQTADGKWSPWPKDVPAIAEGRPGDDVLAQVEDVAVDATYETVKTNGGFNKPAAQVLQVLSSAGPRSEAFKQALNDASSELFVEAAAGFRTAAQGLSGFAKQEALHLAVQASANAGDEGALDRTNAAIDELLAAFPKTFYFADVFVTRAKIALSRGDLAGATKAIDAIKAAPGMNPRDAYMADYAKVYFTLELQKKYEQAASEYRVLVERADRERDAAVVSTTRDRSLVGLGTCLVMLHKEKDARPYFERAADSHDPDVLAGAYTGLGDVVLLEAKALRDGGKLAEARPKLEESLLHYLRVSIKYRADVSDNGPVLRSMESAAKVFITLFDMSGGKDCELADRACKTYSELARLLPDGSAQQRTIVRDYNEIKKRRDECKK